jgi:hypothetical protein
MTAPSLGAPILGLEGRGLADAPPADTIEDSLRGRFRLERPLDGARHVSAAIDTSTGAAVAIKFGRARGSESEAAMLARLRREAEVLRQLDGAGVPLVVDVNERPPWLALERIDGVDLERRLSTPIPLAEPEIAAICTVLAETLSGVHARGFLHADLKPSNIMLREDGAPVLLDFGSVLRLGEESAAGDLNTTPEYAPPEFHTAPAAIGPWSDVYALGAVAYRMIVGRAPVPAAVRLRGATLPATGEAAQSAISDEMAALVDWALELDPAARPLSAEEWRQAVRQRAVGRSADAETIRVRRRVTETRDAARAARTTGDTRSRGRRWKLAAAVSALAVAASAPLAWREGKALYERHFKQEWIVDAAGHGDTSSLADALSRARDGATISVRPGTYRETVAIARPVAVLGVVENGEQPTIAAADGTCILVTASARLAQIALSCVDVAAGQTSIENGRIAGASGPAVQVRNGAELRLTDTAVAGGIVAAGGAGLTMSGGEVRGALRSGVIARGGAELRVSGTQIVGSAEAGILLAEGATARIEHAAIADSGTSAVEIASGAHAAIVDSAIARASQAGIFVVDGGSAEIERSAVTNSGLSGLVVTAAGEAQVSASSFEQNHEHGILVLDLARLSISGSRVVGNGGHGIALERNAAAELGDNVVERNREPQLLDTRKPDASAPDKRKGGAS